MPLYHYEYIGCNFAKGQLSSGDYEIDLLPTILKMVCIF